MQVRLIGQLHKLLALEIGNAVRSLFPRRIIDDINGQQFVQDRQSADARVKDPNRIQSSLTFGLAETRQSSGKRCK